MRSASVWGLLVAGLVGTILLAAGVARVAAHLELRVELPGGRDAGAPWLQVMHASGGAFTEPASVWVRLPSEGATSVSMRLPADQVRWLRLDFAFGTGDVRVCDAQLRVQAERFELARHYSIVGSKQLVHAAFDDEGCLAAHIREDADDPYVVLRADAPEALPSRSAVANVRRAMGLGIAMLLLCVVGLTAVAARRWRGARIAAWSGRVVARLDARLHWLVLLGVLGFGAIHALVGPPNYTPDEASHLSKVARMHVGHPFGSGAGSLLPNVVANHGPLGNLQGNKGVLDPDVVAAVREAPLRCEPEVGRLPQGANAYFPHVYLPTWAVYATACALDASFGRFLDMARLLNLILAAGLIAWGVAVAGPLRWPLAAVALLPMGVAQYASVSSDALTLSMSFAAIGGLAGAASGQRPLRGLWIPLALLALGLALAKPGTPWLLAIALLAWRQCRIQGVGYLPWTLTLVAVPALIHVGWTLLATTEAAVITRDYAMGNRDLLLHDPGRFLGMVWHTFTPPFVEVLWRGAIGRLGWLDIILDPRMYTLATIALAATMLLGGRFYPEAPRGEEAAARAFMVLAALASLVLIALPLFVYWTDPGGRYIQGLQGRYFLPTIAVLAGFASLRSPVLLRLALSVFVLGVVLVVNLEAVREMYEAYYVHGRRA